MKTAVIYARYSSDSQTEQSIEGQLRVCEQYAKNNDILILHTYIDRAMTGTNDNRPDFQQMINDSYKKEWNYVLVYKLDRFSRNKYETTIHKHTLATNGVRVISAMENIPDTPEGIILESLLEGMNQYYSAELAQKIKRGMHETRLKGNYQGGGLPYGYKVENRKIVIDEEESQYVQFMYQQYACGYRVKEIIETLTNKGVLNKGKPFQENIVYRILRNSKYTGVYKHKDEVVENMYPQIVSTELYNKAQESIKRNRYGRCSITTQYLLKGKIICGYCGKPVSSECSTSKTGELHHYYKCRGRKRFKTDCQNKTIQKDSLENIVLTKIVDELKKYRHINVIVQKLLEIQDNCIKNNAKLKSLEREKKNKETQLKNIMKAIELGVVNKLTTTRMQELEQSIEELQTQIKTEQYQQSFKLTKEEITKFYTEALKQEPMALINYLVKEIKLYNDKIEITLNNPLKKNPDNNLDSSFLFKSRFLYKDIEIGI